MSFLDVTAMLLTLAALFGWLNRRFIGLPHTTALLLTGARRLAAARGHRAGLPDYAALPHAARQPAADRLHRRGDERDAGFPDLRRRAQSRPPGVAQPGLAGRRPRVDRHDRLDRPGGRRAVGGLAADRATASARLGAGVRRADQPDRPDRGDQHAAPRLDLQAARGGDAGRGAVQRRRRHRPVHAAGRHYPRRQPRRPQRVAHR